MNLRHVSSRLPVLAAGLSLLCAGAASGLERIKYNNPGLKVDLGVGLWAWPLPMDFDGDGDLDLVVNCPDKPYNGTYFFENATGDTAKNKMPVFKPGRRISKGMQNVQVSYVDGKPVVMSPGMIHPDFLKTGIDQGTKIDLPANVHPNKVRGNMWRSVDYDGDGLQDIVVGADDWTEYGWDNAYDENGRWCNGPLKGFVYVARNEGTNEQPKYAKPVKVMAIDRPVETFGWPSPNFADFDGDGDLDLLCGEFLDGFTYFQNTGTRDKPKYAYGKKVKTAEGKYLKMDLEMITPTAIDWDKDGDLDLIVGDEDGRVAFVENTGKFEEKDKSPLFLAPRYFQQEADDVKFGSLATPVGFDWDGDGDIDIISGNTAGNISFIENLSGKGVEKPKWNKPQLLKAGGKVLRIMAGPNGSIQGPCEAKWGYTTQTVVDWDLDGLPDLLVNSIWGKVLFYKNTGTRTAPKLAAAKPVAVEWNGKQPELAYGWLRPQGKALLTQWRTTPVGVDWNKDGLPDLVMLDQEGYLAFFQRAKVNGELKLLAPQRVMLADKLNEGEAGPKFFQATGGEPLWMNKKIAGGSGRRKLCATDWDGDGKLDLLINAANASFVQQTTAADGKWYFKDRGLISPMNIEGHDVSPAVVDFNGDGVPDFLGGAEDGYFYYLKNPGSAAPVQKTQAPAAGLTSSEFIYDTAPFPSCHASTIARAADGTLLTSWFGGTAEGKPDVGIWVSRQVGGKWSEPVEVANGVQTDGTRHPCWNPVLFQPKEGPLWLFYKVGPSPQTWWGMLRTSTDGGKTWGEAVRLPDGILGPIKNKPVQLANGDILCPTSTESPTKPSKWAVHFERTNDMGKTWTATPALHDGEAIRAIQPSVLLAGGDKLIALGRSTQGKIFEIESNDLGKTWGAIRLGSLPNPNSGTDAVTLKDGRHLLIYNHTPKGRSPLNLAISKDGVTWQAALVLESEKGEYSYPAIIQTPDGKVHVTYTWKREKVKHAVIDPAKLEPKDLVDGNWPQ
ncbi:exo-alpha-sialidase [Verrucomicrobium sp. BvORR034]|uniref:exo-alpha-sialidase n=1 Tax=Verrucomicrobium sp. BvORR034 TaxID=1396418 RepID=UPI0007C7A91C|nr:exo-alpha-sialidase [Verrucomicrobium sp. BvORR034]